MKGGCRQTDPVPEVYQPEKTPWQVSRKNGNAALLSLCPSPQLSYQAFSFWQGNVLDVRS